MNHAEELFAAVPREHNCAQAVACGLGREDLKAGLASCGGGRAPEGLCGALYAALSIVPGERREEVMREFAEKLGSTQCRVLKGELHVPCPECVKTGAELAEKYRG